MSNKYVVYVQVGNLPRAKVEQYISDIRAELQKEDFFDVTDKVLYIPRNDGPTEIVKLQ